MLMPHFLVHVDRVCHACDQSVLSPAAQPGICCNSKSFSTELLILVQIYVQVAIFFSLSSDNGNMKLCLVLFSKEM